MDLITPIVTSFLIFMSQYYFTSSHKKSDAKREEALNLKLKLLEEKEDARLKELDEKFIVRKEEMVLVFDLLRANSKLTYVLALALKKGHCNGEVDRAIEYYHKANDKLSDFIRGKAYKYIAED